MTRIFTTALIALLPLTAAHALGMGEDPAAPKTVGDCATVTVKEIGPRLEGLPDSGSTIVYTDGTFQVSYSVEPAIQASRAGDSVKLCLISVPPDCPKGDDRGRLYRGTNARTGASWTLPNAEHSCGGA